MVNSLIKFLPFSLGGIVVAYLAMAFIKWNILWMENIAMWDSAGRLIFILMLLAQQILSNLIMGITSKSK